MDTLDFQPNLHDPLEFSANFSFFFIEPLENPPFFLKSKPFLFCSLCLSCLSVKLSSVKISYNEVYLLKKRLHQTVDVIICWMNINFIRIHGNTKFRWKKKYTQYSMQTFSSAVKYSSKILSLSLFLSIAYIIQQ